MDNSKSISPFPTSSADQQMQSILNNPDYKGKHVIVADNKVFTANTGDGAKKILEQLRKKYPQIIPAVTYIPDADTLILWL